MQSTPGWQASHSVGEEIVLRNYHWPDPAQPGRVETPGASQPSSNIHEHYGNLSPGYFPPSRDDTVTTDMMDEPQSARDSLAQYWRCAVIKTANSLAISWWSQRRPELKANLTSHCSHSLHIILYLAAERERERGGRVLRRQAIICYSDPSYVFALATTFYRRQTSRKLITSTPTNEIFVFIWILELEVSAAWLRTNSLVLVPPSLPPYLPDT